MRRRHFAALLASAPIALLGRDAWAGSYLNRAALLLGGSRAERDMALPRFQDKDLLRMLFGIARGRTDAARDMEVPKAVISAHPHLLLVLENCERAYAVAIEGSHEKFVGHILRARTEDKTFRAIIDKLGYTLPSV
jgi:hypothetical protein